MWIPLTHLQRLEAEAIHIFREVAANFANPVMLYSVGKDSSVLLHLAMKAFFPAKPPFPFLHVDTTWKFREMIAFRDQMAARLGFDLLVHTNEDGVRQNINPFDHGSNAYTHIMKTGGAAAGARQIRLRRGLRRRPPRRGEVARQGAHLLLPQRPARLGPASTSGRRCGRSTTPASRRANRSASSRCPTGPSSTSGSTSCRRTSRSCRSISPSERPVVERDGMLIMVDDDRLKLRPGEIVAEPHGALPHARLLSADRRDRIPTPTRSRRSSARC